MKTVTIIENHAILNISGGRKVTAHRLITCDGKLDEAAAFNVAIEARVYGQCTAQACQMNDDGTIVLLGKEINFHAWGPK